MTQFPTFCKVTVPWIIPRPNLFQGLKKKNCVVCNISLTVLLALSLNFPEKKIQSGYLGMHEVWGPPRRPTKPLTLLYTLGDPVEWGWQHVKRGKECRVRKRQALAGIFACRMQEGRAGDSPCAERQELYIKALNLTVCRKQMHLCPSVLY